MSPPRQPRRIASRPEHPLYALISEVSRLEPPGGAFDRVLHRLQQGAPRRLVDEAAPDDPVATLLSGLATPEPSARQQARILRSLGPVRETTPRWPIRAAIGLTAAAAVALFALPRPAPSTDSSVDAARVASVHREDPSPRRQTLSGVGELVLSDDARLEVVSNDAAGARLRLDSGRLALSASSRKGRGPLVIAASGIEVRIVGTVLSIDVAGAAPVVTVGEGLVEVTHAGQVTRVGAGQRWNGATTPVSGDASDWAASSMRLVAGDRVLRLDDVLDVTPEVPTPSKPVRSRRPPPKPIAPAPQDDFDLEKLARTHARLPASELSRRVAEARTSFDHRAEAVWLRALADAPDASALQTRTALVELAKLLDDELARPLDAIAVRHTLARRFTILRPEARLQIMLASAELGHAEAMAAIEACREGCADTARSFARFLFARQLQLEGQLPEAEAAMDLARQEASEWGGAERLAELYFLRARHFLNRGQVARAQGAASVCRAFDREGLHTGQLRQQGL